jgi:methylated-DNA-[protein]-cysteine S-methyltransferase
MSIYTLIDSPVGTLTLARNDDDLDGVLRRLAFGDASRPDWRHDDSAFGDVREQLHEYFAGHRQEFDLTLELDGTEWERRVWDTLRTIPYGETRSYGEVATVACERTGAHAARAVGRANNHNPIAIIVPCHRVIGADGKLVGFGGGLPAKRALLDLEAGRLALV